jgi:hypothetical protein
VRGAQPGQAVTSVQPRDAAEAGFKVAHVVIKCAKNGNKRKIFGKYLPCSIQEPRPD